jgi:hypothetical protein
MNKVVNDMLDGNGTAHNETVSELQRGHRELEAQVDERTRELTLLKARFETALRGANVYVYSQDRDLRYSWALGSMKPLLLRSAVCSPRALRKIAR